MKQFVMAEFTNKNTFYGNHAFIWLFKQQEIIRITTLVGFSFNPIPKF